QDNRVDALIRYLTNKLSPGGRIAHDALKNEDFTGKPFDVKESVMGATIPISVQNFFENKDNERAVNAIITAIFDGLGIGSNTYSPSSKESDWLHSDTKELTEFRQKFGESTLKQAAKEY